MTYLLLSAVFVAAASAVLLVALLRAPDRGRLVRRWAAPVAVTGLVLLGLTALFDNLMIAAGLMTYAADRVSGVRLLLMPVEDLAYPLAGLLLLPALWLLTRPGRT